MTPHTEIGASSIEPRLQMPRPDSDDLLSRGGTFQEFKDRAEAAFIRKQLEANGWNISRTAEVLDIQRSHLYNKMRKFGLAREGDE
jgi:DNA-binding NtrC family response regulator